MLLLTTLALAKDMRSHIGIGLYQPIDFSDSNGSISSLSVRYGLPTGAPTLNVGLELSGGFRLDTGTAMVSGGGGLRVLFGLVAEDNMNFYASIAGGYQIRPDADGGGFARITPALSSEFFLFGLENLGFSTDIGLNLDVGSTFRLGIAPALGVRYYF